MRTKRGRFIVVEGLEGAGKSTIVHEIAQFLSHHAIPCLTTREPGGTKMGETLRQWMKQGLSNEHLLPKSELLCMYVSRMQLLEQVIYPALQAGTWVVSDRFELSTFAYQGGGRQLDMIMIQQLSDFCLGGFKPDQLFFLDIPPEQGLQRAHIRGQDDDIEKESLAFFHRVDTSYRTYLKDYPSVTIIPAWLPLQSVIERVHIALIGYIDEAHHA